MQGKLFQRCTYFLCCSVLSLGCKVNRTRRMSQPDMGSIFHIKKSIKYSASRRNYDVNYQNYQNEMLLSSSSTIRGTLLHQLFQYVRREYATAINVPCLITLYLQSMYIVQTDCPNKHGKKGCFVFLPNCLYDILTTCIMKVGIYFICIKEFFSSYFTFK